MMSFDPRFLIAVASLMSLVMSGVLFSMWRSFPRSVAGLAEWSAGPLAWAAAALLFLGRDTLPVLLSVILACTLLLGGTMLFYLGSQRHVHVERAWPWPVWGGLLAACSALLAVFTYLVPSYGARLGLVTLVMSALVLTHIVLLLRQARRGFAVRFMLLVLGLQGLVWGFRLLSVLGGHAGERLFEASLAQTLFVGSFAVLGPLLTIACVLMACDKLHLENEQLHRHDMLTGTLTRRAIMEACEAETERSRRHGHPLSLLMMDLDDFKAINDAQGHLHGDAILMDFATRTSALLRRPDLLGRYGGDEFVLLLPDTDRDAALQVAERIHAAGDRRDALSWRVSVGLTCWRGAEDTLQAMLARADAALYQAKSAGRNRTQAA